MQSPGRGLRLPPLRGVKAAWPWLLVFAAVAAVRLSKGAFLSDAFALFSRPFWPGSAQSEWLRAAQQLDQQSRLEQLEADNRRLRELLELQAGSGELLSAPVISRQAQGWWQQLVIGRGSLQGLDSGHAVLAPGGLLGRVVSVTPSTATVTLLTDSSSRVGVWVGRVRHHGMLVGQGTDRPLLRFIQQDVGVRPGDVVTTSPASTLLPPNLTVGVVQSVNDQAVPAPEAVVQLSAPAEAIDWVQVRVTAP
ncbi:rod shape-determining protein MreC [Cyanobium sp. ATX 6A2]|uniref:rod shape-determining protein MreC n=1 Tax=Cyanobium sp. ATX 6A2 TaxID=2823700 RepID=UPI0020CCE07C|nr:rod shape-determining protein MreC [Cyanobium sp. ATX 6A2]MCP9887029.1 rod shape-determining protein MreC [Cyanobium sp. ATX 6A2]